MHSFGLADLNSSSLPLPTSPASTTAGMCVATSSPIGIPALPKLPNLPGSVVLAGAGLEERGGTHMKNTMKFYSALCCGSCAGLTEGCAGHISSRTFGGSPREDDAGTGKCGRRRLDKKGRLKRRLRLRLNSRRRNTEGTMWKGEARRIEWWMHPPDRTRAQATWVQ